MPLNLAEQTNRNTPGNLVMYNSAGKLSPLTLGTPGQILQVNGNGNGLTFVNVGATNGNFIITDGTNSQIVNSSESINFDKSGGLTLGVTATRKVTVGIDPNGNLQGLLGGTAGDLYFHDGQSIKRLAIGASGRILSSTGTNLIWQAPSGGVGSETALSANDTSTIDFTTSGTANHTLTGSVKLSANVGNAIVANSDGLFVSAAQAGSFVINGTQSGSIAQTISSGNTLTVLINPTRTEISPKTTNTDNLLIPDDRLQTITLNSAGADLSKPQSLQLDSEGRRFIVSGDSNPIANEITQFLYYPITLNAGAVLTGSLYPDYDISGLANSEKYATIFTNRGNIRFKDFFVKLRNTSSNVTQFVVRNLVGNVQLGSISIPANSNSPVTFAINQSATGLNTNSLPRLQFEVVAGDSNIALESFISYYEF